MEKKHVSKKVTATILSMSLLTVMAGAAIAPALGIIKAHFCDASAMLVQFIVSMPALLIIVTNLFFVHFYVSKKGGTTRMVEKVPSLNIEEEAGRVAQEV